MWRSLNWNTSNVLQGSAGGRCTVTSMHRVHMLQKNDIISSLIRSSSPLKVKQTLQHSEYTAFERTHAVSVHTIPLESSPVTHSYYHEGGAESYPPEPQKHKAQWVKHGAVCGTDLGNIAAAAGSSCCMCYDLCGGSCQVVGVYHMWEWTERSDRAECDNRIVIVWGWENFLLGVQ